ncbi:MAG: hypothetical protein NNA31_02560 [Nitrospira sp.]|nr:hypothetical protein [Nitrospira sp.]
METALHDEHPASFRQVDKLPYRFTWLMFVVQRRVGATVIQIPRVVRIDRERHIEEHARAKPRGLVSLNIVHDRIHIHDDHVRFLTHHGHEGSELAILRFNA